MLATIFEQFVQMSPVSIMARGLMERIFAPDRMNQLFARHAQRQHQQELLFSSQVALMSLVVCGIQKSVHAAYKAKAVELSVSTTALYKKTIVVLQQLAGEVQLKRFLKANRGVKKKRPPLIINSQQRHLATARLLETHQTLMKSRVRK